ncbi:tRNA A64-2'-O-ribosylphosphate transferase like protein [Aduncisulcus paluster]|uniref:tRNA A64-2'-O-ribosylphosphate transferase like protein n=1 Tax=Aduncisulcus paluster TaxID=2918883 RepID=A0ABQ5KWF9_9EUKA|nr:tRNA A64-2'-O-ribosylphosphate transferase like protein [Aduncisulcus paluster]
MLAYQRSGFALVDITRGGKFLPDSFSKTIPIWCCVLNCASIIIQKQLSPEKVFELVKSDSHTEISSDGQEIDLRLESSDEQRFAYVSGDDQHEPSFGLDIDEYSIEYEEEEEEEEVSEAEKHQYKEDKTIVPEDPLSYFHDQPFLSMVESYFSFAPKIDDSSQSIPLIIPPFFPPTVNKHERDIIRSLLPSLIKSLLDRTDLHGIIKTLSHPLVPLFIAQPQWLQHAQDMLLSPHVSLPPTSSERPDGADWRKSVLTRSVVPWRMIATVRSLRAGGFCPVVCVNASTYTPNPEYCVWKFPSSQPAIFRSLSFYYIQGAGDDEESWSLGLKPEIFRTFRGQIFGTEDCTISSISGHSLQASLSTESISDRIRKIVLAIVKKNLIIQGTGCSKLPGMDLSVGASSVINIGKNFIPCWSHGDEGCEMSSKEYTYIVNVGSRCRAEIMLDHVIKNKKDIKIVFEKDQAFGDEESRTHLPSVVSSCSSGPVRLRQRVFAFSSVSMLADNYVYISSRDGNKGGKDLIPIMDIAVNIVHKAISRSEKVLICCDQGINRSVSVTVAFLSLWGGLDEGVNQFGDILPRFSLLPKIRTLEDIPSPSSEISKSPSAADVKAFSRCILARLSMIRMGAKPCRAVMKAVSIYLCNTFGV